MKAKLTLTALAIALAAPAFAATTQLERAADVDAGIYTVGELGLIASADTAHEAERLKTFFAENDASTGDLVARGTIAAADNYGEWIHHPGWDDR